MGGKAPAFQFYPGDWVRDLEEHPLEIEGAWIRICCKLWWSETRGKLTRTVDQWARILRVQPEDAFRIIDYIQREKIGTVLTQSNGIVTVMSRRMVREEKEREDARLRQQRHRLTVQVTDESRTNNENVTVPSSSSSSSSKDLKSKEQPRGLPSKDEISESSEPKIVQDLQHVCEELRPSFPKVFAFKNAMIKKHKNPRAILHTLVRCRIRAPDDPWAFCIKIMGVEDGNYNERDWRKSEETSPGRDQALSRVPGASGQDSG